jgi:hypothetical protein
MPALPNATRTLLVRAIGSKNTTAWNNRFHLQYSAVPPTEAELLTVCNGVVTAWMTNFAPVCSPDVSLTAVQVADISSATGASNEVSTGVPGTRVGDSMPNQVACVVSWRINLRYRGGHPRSYLPAGVMADVVDKRLWVFAFRSEVLAAAQGFHADLNTIVAGTNSLAMVAVSYFTEHALRPTPLVLPIVSEAVHERVDTQRRRLGKETV